MFEGREPGREGGGSPQAGKEEVRLKEGLSFRKADPPPSFPEHALCLDPRNTPPLVPQLRGAREADHVARGTLEEGLASMSAQLEARRSEVEQLTTLSLRGDATVQVGSA
eukprot:304881-Chlamydomonas_euryale.AAC.1